MRSVCRVLAGVIAVAGWVRADGNPPSSSGCVISPAPPDTSRIEHKLDGIQIPEMDFRDVPLRQILDQLRQAAAKADTETSDPGRRGVNMVVKLGPGDEGTGRLISVSFGKGSLREACHRVAAAAKLKIKTEPYAVGFVPLGEQTDFLITKEYSSPGKYFLSFKPQSGEIRELLLSNGIEFPPGASASLTVAGKLFVRNMAPNLEAVEAFMDRKEAEAAQKNR